MHDQPRYEPLEASALFADGKASRHPVAGTVARGHLREDDAFYAGKDADGELVASLPIALDQGVLRRGRQRYDIFCAPCHGRAGDGRGMVVQRGFTEPPSFHEQRLRDQPVGYFYDVVTNGFGQMSSYASQITPADRWAIVAYLRALQLSQHAVVAELPASDRQAVENAVADDDETAHQPTAEEGRGGH